MWTCYKGHAAAALCLLNHGASPNVKGEVLCARAYLSSNNSFQHTQFGTYAFFVIACRFVDIINKYVNICEFVLASTTCLA